MRSYHREELRLEFELELDADFEPMFALRGIVERPAPREIERRATGEGVRLLVLAHHWASTGRRATSPRPSSQNL